MILGLVSSLYYRLLHTQKLVSSASSLIYAVISFTKCNRLGFRIMLLIVRTRNRLHIERCRSDGPYYWGFFTFCLYLPHRVRTQILKNPLSSTDYFQFSFRCLAGVTGVIAIKGVKVANSPHFSRGSLLSWVGLIGGP